MGILSYAQNFEDVLLWRALHDVPNGFYIDIGAQHPVLDSVSRAFYEQGWRGLSVEPVNCYAELLRQDRPDESIVQAAIAAEPGELKFFEVLDTGLSTASEEIAREHRSKGYTVRETTVPCITLDQLFGHAGAEVVHWLKIDVEGLEREVLAGWRSAPQRPWVVVIESTWPNSQRETHAGWEDLILAKGYEMVLYDGLNRYYLWQEKPDLRPALRYGPTVFDGFQLAETNWATGAVRQRCEERLAQIGAREQELQAQLAAAQANPWAAEVSRQLLEQASRAENHLRELARREQEQAEQERLRREAEEKWLLELASLREERQRAETRWLERERVLEDRARQAEECLADRVAQLHQQAQQAQAALQAAAARAEAELREQMAREWQSRQQREDALQAEVRQHARNEHQLQLRLQALERSASAAAAAEAALRAELGRALEAAAALTQRVARLRGSTGWRWLHALGLAADEDLVASDLQAPARAPTMAVARVQAVSAAPAAGSRAVPTDMEQTMTLTELLTLPGEAFVRSAYRSILGREADPGGLRHYLARLARGHDKSSVVQDLAASREGRARLNHEDLRGVPPAEFIDALYRRVLGRAPDAAGRQHYLDQLRKHGDRDRVIRDLENSAEARARNAQPASFRRELALLAREQRGARGVLGWFTFNQRLERRLAQMDFALGALTAQVDAASRDLRQNLDFLESELAGVRQLVQENCGGHGTGASARRQGSASAHVRRPRPAPARPALAAPHPMFEEMRRRMEAEAPYGRFADAAAGREELDGYLGGAYPVERDVGGPVRWIGREAVAYLNVCGPKLNLRAAGVFEKRQVRIVIGDRVLGEVEFGAGPTSVVLPVDRWLGQDVQLRLECHSTCNPSQRGFTRDPRELGLLIHHIHFQ